MAWSRAASSRAAKRSPSRDRFSPGVGRLTTTTAAIKPMTASTTMVSTSVKPRSRLFPVTDVGILSLAALLPVGAERIDVNAAVLARERVLIGIAPGIGGQLLDVDARPVTNGTRQGRRGGGQRSEEHTSELQSLMRISYAVFCLKKKKT